MTGPEATAELLPLALSRPREALAAARAVLAARPDPLRASIAHQAVGIVLRELGDSDEAVRELRRARRLARESGSADREADVLATLGVALAFGGRTAEGLATLDRAAARASGPLLGRVLLRRGGVLLVLGRHRDALADLNRAIAGLRAADDRIWLARALTERAFVHLVLGGAHLARADLHVAADLHAEAGQELESADAVMHHGVLAQRLGDLPAALARFDEAAERYERLGVPDPELSVQRCSALLDAGLPQEALQEVEDAIARLERDRARPAKRAELTLAAATCALAADRPELAEEYAAEAARLFRQQDRRWWQVHARLALVRARFARGPVTAGLLADARRCLTGLADLNSPELPSARLLAGRIALALDRPADAEEYLAAAADCRRRGPALSRAVGWWAEALRAEVAGDRRRLLLACRRGLAVIDEYRGALGSSELRAVSTRHGADLAALGQRHAREGGARLLLTWSERWRASALAVPPVRPPEDGDLAADLAALRDVSVRLARALDEGRPGGPLQREQRRLERRVRAGAMRRPGTGGTGRDGDLDVPALLGALGGDRLLEIVDIDGHLHTLVCGDGRVHCFPAGSAADVAREVEYARFWLRRTAFGVADQNAAIGQLEEIGHRLGHALLGGAARHLGDGGVVVAPPGRLHAVPWALLPQLRERALAVAPSAATWLRARRSARGTAPGTARPRGAAPWETGAEVVLVRGPGLAAGGAEIPVLADQYTRAGHEPVVLADGRATVAAALAAMDGAGIAHVAAHGAFRADSPLFSSLRLDDGPMTVYDLERLHRAPRRMVLSSCDSGVTAHAGADELLGLVSALIPLGTSGVVASVVPVNDAAVPHVMTTLHASLAGGATLAAALRDARAATAGDPVATATAWSFVALGAG